MGAMVGDNPAAAAAALTEKMRAKGSNMGEVAKEYGVHRETLAGWFDRLEAAGFPVVGRGSAKKGRKPGKKLQPVVSPEASRGGRVRRGAPASVDG